jgi:hypothetical protein
MPAMKSVDGGRCRRYMSIEVGQHLKCKCNLLSVSIHEYLQKDVNIVGTYLCISTNLSLSQVLLPLRTARYNCLLKCPVVRENLKFGGRCAI